MWWPGTNFYPLESSEPHRIGSEIDFQSERVKTEEGNE